MPPRWRPGGPGLGDPPDDRPPIGVLPRNTIAWMASTRPRYSGAGRHLHDRHARRHEGDAGRSRGRRGEAAPRPGAAARAATVTAEGRGQAELAARNCPRVELGSPPATRPKATTEKMVKVLSVPPSGPEQETGS